MELKSADGPGVVNSALYAVAKRSCLIVSADEKKNLFCIANGSNTYGKSLLRNFFRIVFKEAGVYDKGIFRKIAKSGSGNK